MEGSYGIYYTVAVFFKRFKVFFHVFSNFVFLSQRKIKNPHVAVFDYIIIIIKYFFILIRILC